MYVPPELHEITYFKSLSCANKSISICNLIITFGVEYRPWIEFEKAIDVPACPEDKGEGFAVRT